MVSSNEYMREYMLRRYHTRRAEAIVLLGGRCVNCGATEQLEFDHVDPTSKAIDIAKVWSCSKVRFDMEIAKCELRCKPCHIKKTSKEQGVEHGGGASGKKNCPCILCKARKAEYMRNYRAPVA